MSSLPAPQGRANHRVAPSLLLEAEAAARRCGVTRLADVTRLDRIGLPVWQAVRPAGRALSVHQGKGATREAARMGALCEAIESHAAESAAVDGPCCTIGELRTTHRAPELAEMIVEGAEWPAPDQPIAWCLAEDLVTGKPYCLPHALVSLDFTWGWDSPFERSSLGLGAGKTEQAAREKALLELIENDAVGRWERADIVSRLHANVALDTIAPIWFRQWRARLEALGHRLSVYAPDAATGHPVFVCHLHCADGQPAFAGSACHDDKGFALFAALAEAIQSRLTFIAGARDDLLPVDYCARPARVTLGPLPPVPPGFQTRSWSVIASVPAGATNRLRASGFTPILCKTLRPADQGIAVVKAFVPGLGSLRRHARQERRQCA